MLDPSIVLNIVQSAKKDGTISKESKIRQGGVRFEMRP